MGIYATHLLVTLRVTAGLGDLGDRNIDAFADVHPGVMGDFPGDFTTGDPVLLFAAVVLPGVLVLPRAILKQVMIGLHIAVTTITLQARIAFMRIYLLN